VSFALSALLEGSGAGALPGFSVGGITADSRAAGPGDAFFALPGTRAHGNAFVPQAVEQGAVAIVTDTPLPADPGVPVIVVADVRAALAQAAARRFAPQPGVAVAVTGTSGKTSVASFVRQLWAASGIKAASLGTLGVETEAGLTEGALTTPDSMTLHRTLGELATQGIDHVAMEASSHGIDQRRLDGLSFDAVAFTNLSRDHLDYHPDMESYRDAKLRLFSALLREGGAAVVNTDDAAAEAFVSAAFGRRARLMTLGRSGEWFRIEAIEADGYAQRVTGELMGRPRAFRLPLTGSFQVPNALTAAALASTTGISVDAAFGGLEHLRGAKGRLELVGEHNGAAIFVDYSHKPVALESALASLRPYVRNHLHVVFGAGGDRDRGKRPMMGEVAVRGADRVIVTDDNPRTEDAGTIRSEILAAAPGATEIGDRREAIHRAVAELQPGDVLLVAGKGHEDYQIIGTTKHHFSDHEVVAEALQDLV
jgi:UDP-N-acetylmuramoyl-L-alanyl-D-glutamate--2,6-diaminopimelate ligase